MSAKFNKEKILLIASFVLISLAAVGYTLRHSGYFHFESGEAGGFGVSPPFLRAYNLAPGDTVTRRINLLRTELKRQEVALSLDAPSFADWLTLPAKVAFGDDDFKAPFSVSLQVPPDALPGKYQGRIYARNISENSDRGVSVRLGAAIELDLSVGSGTELSAITATAVEPDFIMATDTPLYERLKGRIIVRVQSRGQAYFVDPAEPRLFTLADAASTAAVFRYLSWEISRADLDRLPVGITGPGPDTDSDGVPDILETAIGTDPHRADSDSDGVPDGSEFLGGTSPLDIANAAAVDYDFAREAAGRLVFEEENTANLWYLNPVDMRRYLASDAATAWNLVPAFGLGIGETDFDRLVDQTYN